MKRSLTIALAGAASAALAGCEYTARQDTIAPWTGNAVAQNQAVQMIDPWPRQAYDTHIPTNGERQAGAYRKYATANKKEDTASEVTPLQLVVPEQK
jgi:hypothetical protein